MSIRRLTGNMVAAMANVLLTGALLFELYRFLVRTIGPESIGIWSLVMATTAAARLGDFGLGSGVVKFVAGDLGAGRRALAAGTIGLAACAIGVIASVLCFGLWPITRLLLGAALPEGEARDMGFALLPWALASLWLTVVANVFLSALDAAQRTTLRTVIVVGGTSLHLMAVHAAVPLHGLAALGPLQVFLAIVVLFSGVTMSAVVVAEPLRSWFTWPRARAKELFQYGGTFQIAALGQLAFEPTVKWLLGVFGTLTLNGYFEMANRAVTQLRQIIASAYQMLVPYVAARLSESGGDVIDAGSIYDRAARLLLLLAVPYYTLLVCSLPFALTLWLGSFDTRIIAIGLICLAGWFLNTLALPAFVLYLAVGRLRWNVATQGMIGTLNLLFAGLLGLRFGGMGVVVGAMLALAGGSAVVVLAFHREYAVSFRALLDRTLLRLCLGGVVAMVTGVQGSLAWAGEGLPPVYAVLVPAGYAFFALFSIIRHPVFAELRRRFTQRQLAAGGTT